MKYFLDTEFHEFKKNGFTDTIELISIGIVDENGREFYAESADFDKEAANNNKWLKDNAIANLSKPEDQRWSNDLIASKIREFIGVDDAISFYGYYCDYDWVVFCWLFGRMIDLPEHFPMYCIDLKQMMYERGLSKNWKEQHCPDPKGEHNALVDAKWNKELYQAIIAQEVVHG